MIRSYNQKYTGIRSYTPLREALCSRQLTHLLGSGILDVAVDLDMPSLISGCVPPASVLQFSIHNVPQTYVPTLLPWQLEMPQDLITIYQDISNLSHALGRAFRLQLPLDLHYFDGIIFNVQQRLLMNGAIDMSSVPGVVRVGLVLYIKSLKTPISLLPETSTFLVKKLFGFFASPPVLGDRLRIWLVFIGALAATEGTLEQRWFVKEVHRLTSTRGGQEKRWLQIQEGLSSILWIAEIHEPVAKAIWLKGEW